MSWEMKKSIEILFVGGIIGIFISLLIKSVAILISSISFIIFAVGIYFLWRLLKDLNSN